MAGNGLPFIQFFPADWLADEKLRGVSLSARGLWMDMLCVMARGDRRGYLELSEGVCLPVDNLARMAGITPRECSKLLAELEAAGVFSRDNGVIYNRRLVRDTEFRLKASEAGRRGGNPAITNKGTLKGMDKGNANTPLFPQSLIISKSQKSDLAGPAQPVRKRDPLFDCLARLEGSNPDQLTRSGERRIAVALAEIRRACQDLTVAELTRRGRHYFSVMPPGTRLTANGLSNNWARCGGEGQAQLNAPLLPPPPEGWKERIIQVFPESIAAEPAGAWKDVPDNIRRELWPAWPGGEPVGGASE